MHAQLEQRYNHLALVFLSVITIDYFYFDRPAVFVLLLLPRVNLVDLWPGLCWLANPLALCWLALPTPRLLYIQCTGP